MRIQSHFLFVHICVIRMHSWISVAFDILILLVLTDFHSMSDKEFLEMLVKALVDNPQEVVIDRTVDEMGVLLTLTVGQVDMGKIIGRSGNTAKAIRTLLRVVGMKHNARVNLKINEPEGGMKRQEAADLDDAMADLKDL